MPIGKALFGCVAHEGKIYVIGGQRKRGDSVYSTNTTEVFDPTTGKWSPGVNMPTARRCTAVVVDNFVIVLGGRDGNSRVATVEVMNPRERVWRRLPDLSERRCPSSVVWLGDRLFLFGDQGTTTRQVTYDLRSKQLEPYPMLFPDGDFATAVAHQGRIYVVGGANLYAQTVSPAIQVFDAMPEPVPARAGEK
jgi:N-acetylneuraminic acid mutarotase